MKYLWSRACLGIKLGIELLNSCSVLLMQGWALQFESGGQQPVVHTPKLSLQLDRFDPFKCLHSIAKRNVSIERIEEGEAGTVVEPLPS